MSSCLIISYVPRAEINDERNAAYLKAIAALKLSDLEDLGDVLGLENNEDTESLRNRLITAWIAYKDYALGTDGQITWVNWPGMDYEMYMSGGMSYGDIPTDAYAEIAVVGHCQKLFNLLLKWAREDWACAQQRKDVPSS